MSRTRFLAAFAVLLVALGRIVASDRSARALVQVFLDDPSVELAALERRGYDVAHADRAAGTVDLVVTPPTFRELRDAGYAFTVMQVACDAAAAFAPWGDGAQQVAVDTLYRDYDELSDLLDQTEHAYPSIAKRYSIGSSRFPREIYALKISDNPAVDEDETTILFDGQHHAREVMSPEVIADIIEYLTTRYATDPEVRGWVDRHEIWLVPSVNPDGNRIVFTQDDFWRKNIRDNNGNGVFDGADGVDLNRNYPFNWGGVCNGSSGFDTEESYRGPHSASEPEVSAMLALEREIRPVFSVDYHSYAQEVYYSYGCDPSISPRLSTIQPPAPDQNLARVLGEEFGARLVQADGEVGFAVLPRAAAVDGASRDHQYHELGTIAFVVELNTIHEGGFAPGYDAWRNATVYGQRPGWKYLLDRIEGPSIGGRVISSSSGAPLLAEVAVDEMTFANGEVHASEPAFGRYHLILVPGAYHLRVRAPGYVERVVPVVVGATTAVVDVALDPAPGVVLLRSGFESADGWTALDPNDDATDGHWVRGDPFGSRDWTYPGTVTWAAPEFDRSAGGGVEAYVTGNPPSPYFGEGDVDEGTTSLVSPSFDAAASYAVELSYWRRFYKSGAEPLDTFTAEVSNDGGATWTEIEELTATTASPTQPQAYLQAQLLLDTRLPLTGEMKLRFRASDRTTDSTVEAAIDEVLVTAIPRASAGLGDLRLDGARSTVVSFSAAPGGPVYDVVRGDLAQLRVEGGHVGLGPVTSIEEGSLDGDTGEFPDTAMPDSGSCFFYLARFRLGYSVGSYGSGTGGLERIPGGPSPPTCAP